MGSKTNLNNINDSHDDNSDITAQLGAVRGDGNTTSISVLDAGAVSGALDFAAGAVTGNNRAVDSVLAFASNNSKTTAESLKDAQQGFLDWAKQSNNAAAGALATVTQSSADSLNAVKNSVRAGANIVDSQKIILAVLGVISVLGGGYLLVGKRNAK